MNVDKINESTPGKILTGLGVSAGIAAFVIVVAGGFFIYGRILDSRLTKLRILQLKKELNITTETELEKLTDKIPGNLI